MAEAITLEATVGSLPLVEPFVISRGVEHAYDVVEVCARWEGHAGWGEATPIDYFGESDASVASFVTAVSGELGDDPFALEEISARLAQHPGAMAAKAGVDSAIHDLCGRLVGLPTWRLLGVPRLGPATARTISLRDPDAMARETEATVGFRLLKLKLGGRDGEDLARVEAVRSVTPVPLTVDVNEYWSFAEALELLPRLARLGVTHVEQPLPAGDPDGTRLRDASPLPVILDEDCHTLGDVAACASIGHGINIKLAKCGGVREAMRMVHAARALDLTVMVGCMGESSLGIAAACPIASVSDLVDLDGNQGLVHDTWAGLDLVDGRVVPTTAPGWGVRRADGGGSGGR